MKVAVIGGGSTYTPELVSGLSAERERIDVTELVLHDVDAERRDVVGGMARRMLERQGFAGTLEVTGDLDRAVEGADFVLLQIRVGGQAARLSDETVPLLCGCVGQETTGAGGFAKALRTVPAVLEIADRVRELAGPDTWIVDFTNPVGIVTRALLDHGHRAIGLCNVAIGLQRWAARLLGVEPARVLVDQVGLNHLTWVRALRVDGEDVLPGLLAERGAEVASHVGLREALVTELGVIPSYYLRYFYCHDEIVEELRHAEPRAAVVAALERELLAPVRRSLRDREARPAREARGRVLQRGGHRAARVAHGRHRRRPGRRHAQRLDARRARARRRRRGAGRIGRAGAVPLPQAPLAPELLGLAQHVAAYERLTAEAAVTRNPVTARKALLTHPLIGQDLITDDLLEGLIAAERRRGGELVQA